MAKVWLKVITQTKTLGDALGTIWPQVVSPEKATLGVGVILSHSYCYGYHDYDCNIYLIFISIEHYLVNILVTFWASIAYIKRMSTLQTFGHSQNQSKFYRVQQYFSLYITLRSFSCMSMYMWYTETYIHTLKAKHWMMFLALCSQQLSDEKNGYFGGRGNLE